MILRNIAIVACLFMAACTTTSTRLADKSPTAARPATGARVLIVQPDIELSLLTVTGLSEPRADWSGQARDNIKQELKAATIGKSHTFRELDPAAVEEPRIAQLLRLHEAVGSSIQGFNYGLYKLPTKKSFDWTLGSGAQTLGQTYDADYALFTFSRGAFSSGGRKAAMVGAALLGVSIPTAHQTAFVSLVDLKTGKVVWYNFAVAGTDSDMRDPEGAKTFAKALLKDAPL
ncbi:hypothetical protein PMI01_01450 [Caulobacter sp. AP07]|uniref:hypothetical protein n=1 Tax=Caulobacter sp. AP07 TaxID=1144304 RepID=UPI0002720BCB|nr:hypothetical protein [Caulobacter sp. AP07]EJL34757.1 hypothetical protein PMI01_01450 [Caulobacter sp. AP07]